MPTLIFDVFNLAKIVCKMRCSHKVGETYCNNTYALSFQPLKYEKRGYQFNSLTRLAVLNVSRINVIIRESGPKQYSEC